MPEQEGYIVGEGGEGGGGNFAGGSRNFEEKIKIA